MKTIKFYICSEMQKLREYLDKNQIVWSDNSDDWEVAWICRTRFKYKKVTWSVIHGYGTYGGIDYFSGMDDQSLEVMIDCKEPIGYLTAADIIELMEKWEKGKNFI